MPAALTDDEFSSLLERFQGIASQESIAVAVSGGPDSMALALLLARWAKHQHIHLTALTVDHGLRNESAEEAAQVHQWLTNHGIEHHILRWEGEKPTANIQEHAREARYNLMTSWCKQHDINDLFVAHQQEDQAETVLLRLFRGSGVDGLAAMSAEYTLQGVRILRPLLSVPKATLHAYLTHRGQAWVEDPSNDNLKFSRVAVRKLLDTLEDKELIIQRLADTATTMQRVRYELEKRTREALEESSTLFPESYAYLNLPVFLTFSEEIALRLLTHLLTRISGNSHHKPRLYQLEALYYALKNGALEGGRTLWGCRISPMQRKGMESQVLICREQADIAPSQPLLPHKHTLWDGRFIVETENIPENHYYISSLGEAGYHELLSIFPALQKNSLPKQIIYTLPTIRTLEFIVAAPYIGYSREKGLAISIHTIIDVES